MAGKSEAEIGKDVMVAASRAGCRLFRFNVGLFYTKDGRPVTIGFKGAPDYWGWTPEGTALFVETKSQRGRLRERQIAFRSTALAANTIHIVARSGDEFLKELNEHRPR